MIVLKLENPMTDDVAPLFVRSVEELCDIEALGMFICVRGDEEFLLPGIHLTVSAVEMSEEEYAALPAWEDGWTEDIQENAK